jgi:hypothetical protein
MEKYSSSNDHKKSNTVVDSGQNQHQSSMFAAFSVSSDYVAFHDGIHVFQFDHVQVNVGDTIKKRATGINDDETCLNFQAPYNGIYTFHLQVGYNDTDLEPGQVLSWRLQYDDNLGSFDQIFSFPVGVQHHHTQSVGFSCDVMLKKGQVVMPAYILSISNPKASHCMGVASWSGHLVRELQE